MKLSVDFARLEEARKSMGAEKANVGQLRTPNERGRSPIEIKLLRRGSVVITDAELEREIHFPSGVAAIGETQVTLHIYQPHASFEDLSKRPAPGPRFHIADCTTLDSMRNAGRFDRYVTTNDQTGRFRVQPKDPDTHAWGEEMEASLAPCMNCLKQLDYDAFANLSGLEKKAAVANFDIRGFFDTCRPTFRCLPIYTANNFPQGTYAADWADISGKVRQRAGWTCSKPQCGVNLSSNRKLLHVHHVDGNRGNNRPSNMRVLCCLCHSTQPLHGHMRISPDERRVVERLRREQ